MAVLAIDNMQIWLSMGGCKILNISDRNMIGLALIMEVIKAGGAILINLPHCQRVEIIEASHRMTTESLQTSTLFKHSTERPWLEQCLDLFNTYHRLPEITK